MNSTQTLLVYENGKQVGQVERRADNRWLAHANSKLEQRDLTFHSRAIAIQFVRTYGRAMD